MTVLLRFAHLRVDEFQHYPLRRGRMPSDWNDHEGIIRGTFLSSYPQRLRKPVANILGNLQ